MNGVISCLCMISMHSMYCYFTLLEIDKLQNKVSCTGNQTEFGNNIEPGIHSDSDDMESYDSDDEEMNDSWLEKSKKRYTGLQNFSLTKIGEGSGDYVW